MGSKIQNKFSILRLTSLEISWSIKSEKNITLDKKTPACCYIALDTLEDLKGRAYNSRTIFSDNPPLDL